MATAASTHQLLRVKGDEELLGLTGIASRSLSLEARLKFPLLGPTTKVPAGLEEAAAILDSSTGI